MRHTTGSEIYDFFNYFGKCVKILKIPYLRYLWGLSDCLKLKMFELKCSFTIEYTRCSNKQYKEVKSKLTLCQLEPRLRGFK